MNEIILLPLIRKKKTNKNLKSIDLEIELFIFAFERKNKINYKIETLRELK